MTAFNDVFYSLFWSKIQNLPQNRRKPYCGTSRQKALNLAPHNSPKCPILRFKKQNKKIAPSQTPPPAGGGVPMQRGGEHPLPTNTPSLRPTSSALRPPKFELALAPLCVMDFGLCLRRFVVDLSSTNPQRRPLLINRMKQTAIKSQLLKPVFEKTCATSQKKLKSHVFWISKKNVKNVKNVTT